MILIVGASGRLGSNVAELLLGQGKAVRAMTRTPLNLAHLKQQGAEVVSGDLRNSASLLSACQGVEQVVTAAHALVGKGDNNPRTVDDAGNRQLIDAAKAAGVKHFVFVSVRGASPDSPLEFFRIKYRTEEYLRASGLSFTILRPSAFMDLWIQLVGQPIIEQGKTIIFGRGTNPINFVAVEDVARFVGIALEDARARNRVIEVGGPENLTLNQLAEFFERTSGRQVKTRHIPLPMMRIMAILMQPINPALSRQIRAGIYMDTADLRYDMTETASAFGIQLTPLEELANRITMNADHLETVSKPG
ncbi:MAG TPA: SDR family oxidoreductase [Ktedonobacteraceae bacterium]|nr:SDR family oxidoreductase [Ktedonobacteraceae bacterium]